MGTLFVPDSIVPLDFSLINIYTKQKKGFLKMAKTKVEKILTIEEQIQKLQSQKNKMLADLYTEVGKIVINEWQSHDIEKIKLAVKNLKDDAQIFFEDSSLNKDSQNEESEREENLIAE